MHLLEQSLPSVPSVPWLVTVSMHPLGPSAMMPSLGRAPRAVFLPHLFVGVRVSATLSAVCVTLSPHRMAALSCSVRILLSALHPKTPCETTFLSSWISHFYSASWRLQA